MRAARDVYLADNGFSLDVYASRWLDVWLFFGVRARVPNTRRHQQALMLHDLHHVVTGFGTDLAGEGEISAWEARRGLMAFGAYVASVVLAGALVGLVVAPRRTIAAWRAAARHRSLFSMARLDEGALRAAYEALLERSVGEVRGELGIPSEGVARVPRGLHARAPRVARDQ